MSSQDELFYALICDTQSDDKKAIHEGVQILAQIVEPIAIPINWIVSSDSVRSLSKAFDRNAKTDRDDLVLSISAVEEINPNDAQQIVSLRDRLPKKIRSQIEKLQKSLNNWTTPKIASSEIKHNVLIDTLRKINFNGLICDSIESSALPFDLYFPSADRFDFAGSSKKDLVVLPTAFSDFESYLSNADHNEILHFVKFLDAAEIANYSIDQISVLHEHLTDVANSSAKFDRISTIAKNYLDRQKRTSPIYFLNGSKFYFYDGNCRLTFAGKEIEPIDVRNYVSPPLSAKNGEVTDLPELQNFRASRSKDKLTLEFHVRSDRKMPYGFAVWGDHVGLKLLRSNAKIVKWIGNKLTFVKTDLSYGENEIEIVMTI